MALFERFFRRDPGKGEPRGNDYYALYDSQRDDFAEDELEFERGRTPRFGESGRPDFQQWDTQLSRLDGDIAAEERRRAPVWSPAHYRDRGWIWWTVRAIAATLALFMLLIAWLVITAPLSKSLEPIAPPQITLLASDGTPIARSGAMVAEPVELEDLPEHVPQAFLAIEDRRFYSHWGVDPRGIARAAWTGRGGGSTITQQLAKFTFLTPEQSLTRKAREALIAFWLETWLTKEEILERYLSNAYFGDNQYGLRAASLHYFYRQPENLLPAQAAMLAGLLQAPSRYAPTRHYERAKARMDQVVAAMVEEGYLTEAEAAALPAPRIDSRTRNDLPTGTYFADWALPIARERVKTGYASQVITTTLDARLQALANRVTGQARLGKAQVALVAMRPNGEVVAMIGGKNYGESPFNRVTQARRQPGSTFKLFVYLAALEAGWDPADTIPNTPFEAGSYQPKNYGGRYSETITLEDALATSSNVAAVRLLNEVGSERVIRMARALGVQSKLAEGDPSLALGTSSMTLLELTAAYGGVANNEFPVRPRAFADEEQSWFEWLTTSRDSFGSRVHEDIEEMLRASINRGTGRAAMLPIANYGKTGTSQDSRDAVFVGYAGDLVVGVWVGNDDNSPMTGITGGSTPARIWKDFMRGALSLKPAPRPTAAPDPEGPIVPFDLEDGATIPIDERGGEIRLDAEGVTLSIEVDGQSIEARVGEEGLVLEPVPPD